MIDFEDIKIKMLQEENKISYHVYEYGYYSDESINRCFEIYYPNHNKSRVILNESTLKKHANRLAIINLVPRLRRSIEKKEEPKCFVDCLKLIDLMTQSMNEYHNTKFILLEKKGIGLNDKNKK